MTTQSHLVAVVRAIADANRRMAPGTFLARFVVPDDRYIGLVQDLREEFPGPLVYQIERGVAGAWMADATPPNVFVHGVPVFPQGSVA